MVTHSNDGSGSTDSRAFLVPAMDWPPNSMRPVFLTSEAYPRFVFADGWRGHGNYAPEPGQNVSAPAGHIPQVAHTYALYEATYGILNEHGVSMGETTCSSVDWSSIPTAAGLRRGRMSKRSLDGGEGGFMCVDEMSRIALERTKTARDAVALMGDLAVRYGFVGEGGFEGLGETMLVADGTDAWVFHVLPDPTGLSAVWAAQRVPDDSMSVVANMFVIREMDLSDAANFLYSAGIQELAATHGLWTPGTAFDFTRIYSDGEYAHLYYSGRRMWGAFSLAAPSLRLSPTYTNLRTDRPHPYPFAVKPDAPLTAHDFMAIHRSWYAGTPFDMTQGIAAGPFGTPNRYGGGAGEMEVAGNWERSITLYRTGYSFVVEVDPAGAGVPDATRGTLWFGPHAAHGTCYVPMPSGALSIPEPYRRGHQAAMDRSSAFWAHRVVENIANLRFNAMYPHIINQSLALEAKGDAVRSAAYAAFAATGDAHELTRALNAHALAVVDATWQLQDKLLVLFADGYLTTAGPGGAAVSHSIGYPSWWLRQVGYPAGPPPPPAA